MGTLSRYTPAADALQTVFNRLVEDTIRPFGGFPQTWSPAMDLYETSDHYQVEMALPGLSLEDIEITYKDTMLMVKGEYKQSEAGDRRYHHQERRTGQFVRTVGFSNRVNFEGITATYQNGILSISLPKAEEAKPRKVNIQTS